MRTLTFGRAADDALGQAMAADPRIIVMGEDVPLLRRELLVRCGPRRVRGTPISESAFLGAGVAAAMAGMRPVVELYMVDFLAVAMDSLLNHAAKVAAFSGGRWAAPVVIRAPCGGGYGDGGQHEQALWGGLAHIPGLAVVVPSTPADAGGLMLASLCHDVTPWYSNYRVGGFNRSAQHGRFSALSGPEVHEWRGWVVLEGCQRRARRRCGNGGGPGSPSAT